MLLLLLLRLDMLFGRLTGAVIVVDRLCCDARLLGYRSCWIGLLVLMSIGRGCGVPSDDTRQHGSDRGVEHVHRRRDGMIVAAALDELVQRHESVTIRVHFLNMIHAKSW